jgi:hypothetical protein
MWVVLSIPVKKMRTMDNWERMNWMVKGDGRLSLPAKSVIVTDLPPQPLCTVCHSCPVDAEGGFDTCDECLSNQ